MKPSPLLLKAGLVVGLGAWAAATPQDSSATGASPCNRISTGLLYCPINPEDYCALYSCPPVEVFCFTEPWEPEGEVLISCGGFT